MRELDKLGREHFRNNCLARFAMALALCTAGSLLLAGLAATPAQCSTAVSVGISVNVPPPALPVYVQPACPGPNYIWTPGYWAWDPAYGYYWIPGTWVLAPTPGWLWTPGYWGWFNGAYLWHAGYWGPVVGFYGGINYGYGYTGHGYHGGYWEHGTFYYNRTVNNVNVTHITNVYTRAVPRSSAPGRVSFNGGHGGTVARPTPAQQEARQKGFAPSPVQHEHEQAARRDPGLRASGNHGHPSIAATPRPGEFSGPGVVHATRPGAPYKAPAAGRERPQMPAGAERHYPQGEQRRDIPAPPGGHTAAPPYGQPVPHVGHPQRMPYPAPETQHGAPQQGAPHGGQEGMPHPQHGGENREEGGGRR